MKYYKEYKVKSYKEISDLLISMHKTGIDFAFHFDLINKLRFFSDEKKDDWIKTPITQKFVKCERVRALERKTPRQQQKRIERLKIHLAKKGIEYKQDSNMCKAESDYYINVFSFSSQRSFRLNIKNTVVFKEKTGEFDSYGLSKAGTTLPLF